MRKKPSVAQEFAKALHLDFSRKDGYLEATEAVVTWCVGHLVTMSYPEVYDIKYKRWTLETLPFLPGEFKYEVIPSVKKQFEIVKGLLNRRMWTPSMSVPTQEERESISTVWWHRWPASGEERETCLDRFPDGRGDHPRNQRSEGSECL